MSKIVVSKDDKQRKLDFIGTLYPMFGYSAPPTYHRMDDSELSHAMHLAISVKLAMKELDAFARECYEKYYGKE